MSYSSALQEPGNVQQQVCVVLGLPQHKVTVRCKRTGGGFGGKERLLLSAGIDTDIVRFFQVLSCPNGVDCCSVLEEACPFCFDKGS